MPQPISSDCGVLVCKEVKIFSTETIAHTRIQVIGRDMGVTMPLIPGLMFHSPTPNLQSGGSNLESSESFLCQEDPGAPGQPNMNRHHRTAIAGATTPTSKPPETKSRASSLPVEKATAFGGVEIGRHIATDAPSAMGATT